MDRVITQEFDRQGAMTEFTKDCIACPIHERIKEGIRGPGKGDCYCKIIKKDCPWVITSARGNGLLGVAPSSRVFRKYGFDVLKGTIEVSLLQLN